MRRKLTVETFESWLDEIAPAETALSWDNVGLQLGDPGAEVRKVLGALDPTLSVVREAVEEGCDLIVTHHPLFFKPLSCINTRSSLGEAIKTALQNEVSIISAHTNLDGANNGVTYILSTEIGLERISRLKPSGKLHNMAEVLHLARIGEFGLSKSVDEVCSLLKTRLGVPTIKVVCADRERAVKKLLVCGGSGGSMVAVALEYACDALVTGDVKYHDAMSALEEGLVVFDVGHFSSEYVIVVKLIDFFQSKAEELGVELKLVRSKRETDPFVFI